MECRTGRRYTRTANIAVYPGGYTLDQIGPGAEINEVRH